MITERTLKKWRAEALRWKYLQSGMSQGGVLGTMTSTNEAIDRILRLTQELLDQHLIRKEKKRND